MATAARGAAAAVDKVAASAGRVFGNDEAGRADEVREVAGVVACPALLDWNSMDADTIERRARTRSNGYVEPAQETKCKSS